MGCHFRMSEGFISCVMHPLGGGGEKDKHYHVFCVEGGGGLGQRDMTINYYFEHFN